MKTHASNQAEQVADSAPAAQSRREPAASALDDRAGSLSLRRYQKLANDSSQAMQLKSQARVLGGITAASSPMPREQQSNDTGMPDALKSGIESLSGMSMDHVKVHYNSDKPSQLQAHAYAQGSEIHLAPGQETHLPHEAWHVVQQAQGRVQPTMQMNEGVAVNDDPGLEGEADVMGARALQAPAAAGPVQYVQSQAQPTLQAVFIIGEPLDGSYYNQFSLLDAVRYLSDPAVSSPEITSIERLAEILAIIEQQKQNFTWEELIEEIAEYELSKEEKKAIDDEAIGAAKQAAAGTIGDIEVAWQYYGNIAEATTRFVRNENELGLGIMVDVNAVDDSEYDQYDRELRLGQRITMFTHELIYHGNLQAQDRFRNHQDNPDLDHRLMFQDEDNNNREVFVDAFKLAVANEIAKVNPPTEGLVRRLDGLIHEWYDDMKHHIEEYSRNDPEQTEAEDWADEKFDEMIALVPVL